LAIIIFFSRHEIERAWGILQHVDWRLLILLIPLQFVSYFAAAEMIFAYLRQKRVTKAISPFMVTRLALEMNFVNHVLPSGGVSGISFMGWRLKHFGISLSRSTTAQLVRMVSGFASYTVLLVIAVIAMAFDGNINRYIVGVSVVLVTIMVAALGVVMYVLKHEYRIDKISASFVKHVNKLVKVCTFNRIDHLIYITPISRFLKEIQADYVNIRENKGMLKVPFAWGLLFSITEVALFYVTFLALGEPVNPAPILIAYGLAGIAGFFVVTPGGAGAYEFAMVSFLALSGINPEAGIAGILLTRVLLMLCTIVFGYAFYQQAIFKYGKQPTDTPR
jgi:uncharacterized protein (TIRG00374 family)